MTRPQVAASSPRRAGTFLAVALAGLAPAGCARDGREITPTTSGTNLRTMPRGRMIPQPFPGSSLARSSIRPNGGGPTADPKAAAASVEVPPR